MLDQPQASKLFQSLHAGQAIEGLAVVPSQASKTNQNFNEKKKFMFGVYATEAHSGKAPHKLTSHQMTSLKYLAQLKEEV